MFEGFERTEIETSGARIHLRHGGDGPPLLLLHGNPQTHVSWHLMAPELAKHFHVVAADLRGYGDSSAPEPDETCSNYSFRAMAQDQVEVMQALGYDKFYAAGHDRGARTVHRMALDHPEKVLKAAVVDILPSRHIWENASREWAMKSWHWVFMAQGGGLPEGMMEAVPAEWYMKQKLGKPGIGIEIFAPEAWAEYVRCFTPKTIKGSCADYRAAATIDLELDRADSHRKVTCPLLAVWGVKSHTEAVFDDVLGIWRQYAENVTGGPVKSGHYVPEHAPEALLEWFMRFFPDN